MVNRKLTDDFREFLKFLEEEKVEFLIIGGFAVGFHGHPRTTGDMDIWIAMTAENAKRVVKALYRFGFQQDEAKEDLFLEPGNVVRMGWPPMRIEIFNVIDGVQFSDCYERREIADFDGLKVPVIALDDLIKNKRASGRNQDIADIDALLDEST